jgi:hypothetical protein
MTVRNRIRGLAALGAATAALKGVACPATPPGLRLATS